MRAAGIRNKIFFLLVGSTALLSLAVIFAVKGTVTRKLDQELRGKGVYITTHLATSSADFLLTKQDLMLQLLVNNFLDDGGEDIRYVFIQDCKGNVVAHTFADGFPTGLYDFNRPSPDQRYTIESLQIVNEQTPIIDIAVPVMDGRLGAAHIGISEEHIQASVRDIIRILLMIIAGILTIGCCLAILLARKLTAPLADLVEVANQVGQGNLERKAHISTSDELGRLGTAFNQMIAVLQTTTVSREEYQRQSQFLFKVIEAIPYPFYIMDVADYSIKLANSAVGMPDDDLPTTCYALTHKRTRPCGQGGGCVCPVDEVKLHRKSVVVEHTHFDRDGAERYFEVHGYPIFDDNGDLVQMIEFSMDITERKKGENELLQGQEELAEINNQINANRVKLQEALNQISMLIEGVVRDKNLDVRYTNPNITKCYERMNCTKTDCLCYGKDGAVRCWQVAGTFCGGNVQGDFAQKYKNCSQCQVFQKATEDPILQIGEHFNNMMHIIEVKNKELEKAIADLKHSQTQILQQEKMATIGQLAAGVAHEINNPMGFITSNLGTLEKYVARFVEFIDVQTEALTALDRADSVQEKRKKLKLDYVIEDTTDLLHESLDGAKRVTEIVRNLKSFSRIDEEKVTLSDINECIETTLKIIWNELKYKTTVNKEYGDLPPTLCNPQELNQVFMNLLVNAAQAIDQKGEITIRTCNGEGFIRVVIADTGCGIPRENLDKIFEPFFTTKEVGKGTGLGMSIAYDIIKKHNGEISVVSEVGKGTTFTIAIPVAE
jgi:signal transduction histidine kinase